MPKKSSKKKKRRKRPPKRKKKDRIKRRKKAVNEKLEPQLQFRRINMKVIGIGGGGSSIVSEIAPKLKRIKFLVANTDWQALKTSNRAAGRFQFGQNLTQGLGTGMNAQLGETAALEERERIKKIFQGEDLSILVATLGGGVGSGAGPVFAKIARGLKNLTIGVFTLPFEFEGKKREEIAEVALEKLKPNLNTFVIIPNDKIFQIIDEKTPLRESLSVINKILAESLQGLIEMIYLPGLINIDFADLKAALEGRGRLSYLATTEAQGDNRAEEGVKKLLSNPLYQYGISGAERILFNISGSKELSINEVEKISKSISNFNPRAKIIFGLSQRDDYQDRVKITLLAVGCEKGKIKPEIRKKKKRRKKIKKETGPKLSKKIPKERKKRKSFENNKSKENKVNVRISRTALDIKKDLEKVEKEIVSKENELDVPAFLRKRTLRLR